jgi:hypothetical protein
MKPVGACTNGIILGLSSNGQFKYMGCRLFMLKMELRVYLQHLSSNGNLGQAISRSKFTI